MPKKDDKKFTINPDDLTIEDGKLVINDDDLKDRIQEFKDNNETDGKFIIDIET